MSGSNGLTSTVAAQIVLFVATVVSCSCGAGPTAPTRVLDSPLQDLLVEVLPDTGAPQDVSIVTVTVANPTLDTRQQVQVNLVVPDGIGLFAGFGTDGSCANLLGSCVPGAVLSWTIASLEAGDRRTFLAPALIQQNSSANGTSRVIPFAAVMNWMGGGGATSVGRLEASYKGTALPAISTSKHTAVTGRGLRLELQSSRSSVSGGSEFVVTFTVVNESTRPITRSTLRFVIPHNVVEFSGYGVQGSCSNLLNNCYPGVILGWDIGTMAPQNRREFQVPLKALQNAGDAKGSRQITLCGTAYGDVGSGGLACTSVSVS